jgi:hypothetical protein
MATTRRAGMFTSDGKPSEDDRPISPRGVPVGTNEEYARHMGHPDLSRERIDGRIGR